MELSELFDDIESPETSAQMNLASDPRTATTIAASRRSVGELATRAERWDAAVAIVRRVLHLTRLTADSRYENPYDAALAIYLMVLADRAAPLGVVAASAVTQVPNLWWASTLANSLISAKSASGPGSDAVERVYVSDVRWLPDTASFLISSIHSDPREATFSSSGNGSWSDRADSTADTEPVPA